MKNMVGHFEGKAAGADPTGEAFDDDGVDIEAAAIPGFGFVFSMKPRDFEKFRIVIDMPDSYKDGMRQTLEAVEQKLGFRFPGGIPVVHGGPRGFEFEDKPSLKLPEGWRLETPAEEERVIGDRLIDDQGRRRGFYRTDLTDRSILSLIPRFQFDNPIVATTPLVETHKGFLGDTEVTYMSGNHPYFMPSVTSCGEDIIPCFIYANVKFWPEQRLDFTRIGRELKAIDNAITFIARQTKSLFPGADIRAGTEQTILRAGWEKMAMGIPLPGDVFAYWAPEDQPEIESKIARLRSILETEVPRILGRDNSMILSLFPSPEQMADIKAHTPEYVPPPPRRWQRGVYWAFGLFGQGPG